MFPKKERRWRLEFFNSGTNVGAMLAPVGAWISLRWGWRGRVRRDGALVLSGCVLADHLSQARGAAQSLKADGLHPQDPQISLQDRWADWFRFVRHGHSPLENFSSIDLVVLSFWMPVSSRPTWPFPYAVGLPLIAIYSSRILQRCRRLAIFILIKSGRSIKQPEDCMLFRIGVRVI